jgi:hypothetical protein
MANSFAQEWYPILVGNGIEPEWPEVFLSTFSSYLPPSSILLTTSIDDDDLELEDDVFDD